MTLKKPKWAPYAIPTSKGWVDPRTNELLISKKGLLDSQVSEEPVSDISIPETTNFPIELSLGVQEDISLESISVQEVPKRKPGRPKKIKNEN